MATVTTTATTGYHTLLPIMVQQDLKDAAQLKNIALIDKAAQHAREIVPRKFHTEESRSSRVFFHEPTRGTPMANFVVPWAVTNPNKQRFE